MEKSLIERMYTLDSVYRFFYPEKHLDDSETFYTYLFLLQEQIQHDSHLLVSNMYDVVYIFSNVNPMSLFLVIVIFVLIIYILYIKWSHSKEKSKKRSTSESKETDKQTYIKKMRNFWHGINFWRTMWLFIFIAFLGSIPWEFCRLYQTEVAKRASVMQAGSPPECIPENMTIYQSIKYWLQWHLSWQHDPCEKYHKAVLVDPVLEIPPLLVLSSAFTRCILHPLELFSTGVGKCLKLFFSEIPAVWQPIMLVTMTIIFIVTMVMICGYRLSLPFLLKIEPKTPILGRLRSFITHDDHNCCTRQDKKQLDFSENT